jgi:hypothetical protein
LKSTSSWNLSLLAAFLFIFFVLLTAPHLVHHSFDDSQPTACQAFAIAKGCHIKPVSVDRLLTNDLVIETFVAPLTVWIPRLTTSPFSPRAPPAA